MDIHTYCGRGMLCCMEDAPTPAQLVGGTLKKLRASREWSQEIAARRLASNGLAWNRQQVADFETGRRQDVTLSELVLMAETFGVRISDLLGEHDGPVHVGDTERPLSLVRGMLAGDPPLDLGLGGPVDIPGLSPELHGPGPYWVKAGDRVSYIYGSGEVYVARRLGLPIEVIHEAARGIWDGRIFDVERVRRLTERRNHHAAVMARKGALSAGEQPDPADITAELIEELQDRLAEDLRPAELEHKFGKRTVGTGFLDSGVLEDRADRLNEGDE